VVSTPTKSACNAASKYHNYAKPYRAMNQNMQAHLL
jgi:hypothetical protein